MFARICTLFALLSLAAVSADASGACSGTAKYRVSFSNFLSGRNFAGMIPEGGLVYSPLTAISHSNRVSFLTVRGYASTPVATIAKSGNNIRLYRRAMRMREMGLGVKSVAAGSGPIMPGTKGSLMVQVDCSHHFITAISMIAPSPDWIVQVNNFNVWDREVGFIKRATDLLIAYDAGVDSGREFTDPANPDLDIPTEPALNIAPLVEDETDRFNGRFVGRYIIERID